MSSADADGLVAYRSQSDVCRWVPFEPMDPETVASRLAGPWARSGLDSEGDALTLGVELAATGELIGDVLLHWASDEHRRGELGYVFHPDHAGRGFATEAAHAMLHLAFDELALHRVVARVVKENVASARVAGRLGMRQEALLLESEWFKGRWSDVLHFAILDREWQQQHTRACPGD